MDTTHTNHIQFYFLLLLLILATVFLVIVIGPFITTLLLSIILVVGFYPLYKRLTHIMGNRPRGAALSMAVLLGLLFSGPLVLFFILLSQEAVTTYQTIEKFITEGRFNIDDMLRWLSGYLRLDPEVIMGVIAQAVRGVSGFIVEQSANILKHVLMLVFNFFLLFFSLYFFFKDGPRLIESAKQIIPLPEKYEDKIFHKFKEVSLAMLYGIFLTAILQGILGGIGLAVAGIENAVFWGTVMGIFGMLPVGGTAIVWLPAALILLFNAHYVAGIGLLIWGIVIVGLIDNFVKPMLIQHEAAIYPLATFLVVIGGLVVFGLKGAILSPMILVVFLTLAHAYELERLHTGQ